MSLVLIAAQSNGIIPGVTANALPERLQAPDPMVHIWMGDHFEILTPGVNTGGPNTPTAVGPEVEFAARWRADHPGEELYLVKSAKGSTGLAMDPGELDWSPWSHGEMFDATTVKLRQAQAALAAEGKPSDLSAVVVIIGEQDAVSALKAEAHFPNLTDFFVQIRATWGDPSTPIVLARLDVAQNLPFLDQVRNAEHLAAGTTAHVALADTDSLTLQPDRLHYDAAGAVGLGDEIYDALIALSHSRHGGPIAWPAHGDFLEP